MRLVENLALIDLRRNLSVFFLLSPLLFLTMNLINYIQFLEPMQDQFTRVFSTMSGVIGVILVLWVLNFIAGLIQKTYSIGKIFGSFYRNYLHKSFKTLVVKILSIFRFRRSQSTAWYLNKSNSLCLNRLNQESFTWLIPSPIGKTNLEPRGGEGCYCS